MSVNKQANRQPKPTVLYDTKSIPIDKIRNPAETITQCRLGGLDINHSKAIERSLPTAGLEVPISVEVKFHDNERPERSEYILRDGAHRLDAYDNLHKQFPEDPDYQQISCTVYEKLHGAHAETQWRLWQHKQNEHLNKIHLKNTIDDSISVISQALEDGAYCAEATKHVKNKNWDHPSVKKAIERFAKNECKSLSKKQQEDFVDAVAKQHGIVFKSKIKRYSRKDILDVLEKHYGAHRPGGISADGKKRVWVINNNDWDKQINQPLRYLAAADNAKDVINVFIFHSKQTDPDKISSTRISIKNKLNQLNDWFGKYVKGHKDGIIFDEYYCLGQHITRTKNKEKEFELIRII